jgi:hypothetical protein
VGEGPARRHRGVERHGRGRHRLRRRGQVRERRAAAAREREEGRVIWPYRLKIKAEKVFERPKPRSKGAL